jgi:hypothetical protein
VNGLGEKLRESSSFAVETVMVSVGALPYPSRRRLLATLDAAAAPHLRLGMATRKVCPVEVMGAVPNRAMRRGEQSQVGALVVDSPVR